MAISNETKVGFLVIAALGGLAWMSVKSGSFGTSLTTPMRDFTTTFSNVEGISKGSPVKVAGVPVGDVTDIELQPNGTAVVTLEVKRDVPLPADVIAQVDTSGLIGEKFIALVPGPQGQISGSVADIGLLSPEVTQIPGSMATAGGNPADKFSQVADDLQSMTANLRSVLGNPENAAKLQNIIDGMSTLSKSLEGNSGEIIENVRVASGSLRDILDKVQNPNSPLGQLLMGNQVSGSSGGMLADMQQAMRNLNEITSKINGGEGTIGQLVNDPKTAEKLNGALDSLASIGKKIDSFKTEIDFQAYSLLAENGAGKGEFGLRLQPKPNRYYLLGVQADGLASLADDDDQRRTGGYYNKDFGHTTKFTAQFGHIWPGLFFGQDLGMRVGLKNSTGGVGLDARMPMLSDLRMSFDAYDFGGANTPDSDSPHLDFKASYPIAAGFYGLAGYDNMLSQEYGSAIVGLGYRFEDEDLKYLLGGAL